jgi:uridine phosphorylase
MAMKDRGLRYHLKIREGDVGRYVLLPGDPGRCARIAAHFHDARLVARNREFETWTGTIEGAPVSAVSTGIGGPSTAIAMEELIASGADTFIRVGTSGAIQPHTQRNDIAIVTAAIRDEGTTRQYLPIEFPAVADPDVVQALIAGAKQVGVPFHVGVSHSKDSFYGETEPERMPLRRELTERWAAWVAGGAICSEMEAGTIFILASIHRKRAGGVMVMGAPVTPACDVGVEAEQFDPERAIAVAVAALRILARREAGSLDHPSSSC